MNCHQPEVVIKGKSETTQVQIQLPQSTGTYPSEVPTIVHNTQGFRLSAIDYDNNTGLVKFSLLPSETLFDAPIRFIIGVRYADGKTATWRDFMQTVVLDDSEYIYGGAILFKLELQTSLLFDAFGNLNIEYKPVAPSTLMMEAFATLAIFKQLLANADFNLFASATLNITMALSADVGIKLEAFAGISANRGLLGLASYNLDAFATFEVSPSLPYSIPASLTFASGGTVTQAVHSSRIVQGYTGPMARIVKADRTLIANIGFKENGLWNKEALEALDNISDLFCAGVYDQTTTTGTYLPNGGVAGSEPLIPFRTAGVYSLAGIDYSKTTALNTQSTTKGTVGFKVFGSTSNALKFDLPDMSLATGGGADAVEVFVSLMPHTRRSTGTAIATADVGYQSATLASGTQMVVAKSGAIVNYWSVRTGVTGGGNLKQMRRLASGTADQYTVNKGVQNLVQKANCLEVYSTSMSRGAGSTQDQCNLYDLSQDLVQKSDLTNTVSTGNTTSNSTMSGSKIIFGGLPNAGLTAYSEPETLTLFGWVVVRNCTAQTRKKLTLALKRACNTDTLIAPASYVQPIEKLLFKDVTASSGNLMGANNQLTMNINRSTPQKTLTPAGIRIKMNYTFTAGSPNMITAVTPPYPLGTRDTSITAVLTYTGFTANPVITINNDGTFAFVSGGTWTTGTPTITLAGCYDMPPAWSYQDTQNAYSVQGLRSLADMNTANWMKSQTGTFLESLTEGTFITVSLRDAYINSTAIGNIGYDLVLSTKDPATYNTAVEANNIGARPTDESLSINWEEHSSQGWHRNNVALSLDIAGVKGVATTSIGIQVNVSEQAQEKYFDKLTGKPSINPTVTTPETFDTKNNRTTTQTQPTGVLDDNYALTNYGRSHHATPECRSYPQTSLVGSFGVVNERGVLLVSVGRFKNSTVFANSVTADDRYSNARTADAEANSFHLFAGNMYNHHFDYANNLGGASNFKAVPNSILATGVDGVGNLKGERVLTLFYNKYLPDDSIHYVVNNLDLFDSQFAVA
jgi:hypothetical protein